MFFSCQKTRVYFQRRARADQAGRRVVKQENQRVQSDVEVIAIGAPCTLERAYASFLKPISHKASTASEPYAIQQSGLIYDRKNYRRKREKQISRLSHGYFSRRLGIVGTKEHASGCHTRSLRRSGDHLYAMDGEKPDYHRRSGNLSDRDHHDFCSQSKICARLFRLRLLLRLHYF